MSVLKPADLLCDESPSARATSVNFFCVLHVLHPKLRWLELLPLSSSENVIGELEIYGVSLSSSRLRSLYLSSFFIVNTVGWWVQMCFREYQHHDFRFMDLSDSCSKAKQLAYF